MRKKSKGDTWDGIFADPEVGRVLKANGLIADANKSSIEELSQITTLNTGSKYYNNIFYKNTRITKFPELQYCTGLTNLQYAFNGCSKLTEVIIPDSVTRLDYTFEGCSSLNKYPVIPASVTDMLYTFKDCIAASGYIIILATTLPRVRRFHYNDSRNPFDGASVSRIYVPDELVSRYKSGWIYTSIIYPISSLPK